MSFRSRLIRLFAVIPAIVLATIVNVFITFTVAGFVLFTLIERQVSKPVSLGAALLTALIVYSWIVFNHKLRAYIKQQGTVDE
jgi:hypothetical protein